MVEADPTSFERFAQAFYSALVGKDFVPLGGIHDGGAEGFLDPELFGDTQARHFLQVSKQEGFRSKIRQTVRRLREVKRNPTSLTYLTSEIIPYIDKEEEALGDELNCQIRIRDGKFIETNVNTNGASIAAFNAYLRPTVQFLLEPGAAPVANRISLHADKTLAVFLRQEVEHRRGHSDLLESVGDSLILWALGETDPDKGIFLTRNEILKRIESTLPSAKHIIRGILDHRLEALNEKNGVQGRQIRFYRKHGQYCLPYETRQIVSAENIEDASLRIAVTDILKQRFGEDTEVVSETDLRHQVVEVCHGVFERIFEKQGLQVAQFVADRDQDDDLFTNVADLAAIVANEKFPADDQSLIRRHVIRILRGTFYDSRDEERSYLEKLSRTYILMLLLKNEPKVVEFFKTVSSKFVLYIGTDFIVRSLSEHYLDNENSTTTNLLKILSDAGATLILTEKTVEEVVTHLRAQIFEFEHVYSHLEHRITFEMVEYIDRILIRSYFYARLNPISDRNPPKAWRSYIEQFAPYPAIRNGKADDQLARYLCAKYGFQYETTEEMLGGTDAAELDSLKLRILEIRSEYGPLKDHADVLAYNDALHVLRVYTRRRQSRESSPGNRFGFQTWWLTQDSKVRRAAAPLVAKHKQLFMMRPEFLLNFIAIAPSTQEVVDSYRKVFPSVLGIRLSNRVASHTVTKVLRDANEMWEKDEARSTAIVTELLDALKSDNLKRYELEY